MSDLQQLLPTVTSWLDAGKQVAAATVIQTWQSAPHRPGAKLFITNHLDMIGSVSAGCVENAVIEYAQKVIRTGIPQQLHFGVSNDTAFEVGLACGGEIEVFVEPWHKAFHHHLLMLLEARQRFEILTQLDNARHRIIQAGQTIYDENRPDESLTNLGSESEKHPCFIQRVHPQKQIIIIGGNHIAQFLAKMAKLLGYYLILIDPRTSFANPQRFPDADRILNVYPQEIMPQLAIDEETAIVVLSHDPKFDEPALACALESVAGYIGALGSQTNQLLRRKNLLEKGFSETSIQRIHGPIGLAIGASSPEQIAVAILAEMIQVSARKVVYPEISLV